MEIEKGKLPNGIRCLTFKDQFDEKCEVIISSDNFLRFAFEYVAYFSQEDIKTLLPYLQSFAETGTIEPQEPTLQGDDIDQLYEKVKRENAILAATNEYVKELKQLVREWRHFFDAVEELIGDTHSESGEKLTERTTQLLGEEWKQGGIQDLKDELSIVQKFAIEQEKRIKSLVQLFENTSKEKVPLVRQINEQGIRIEALIRATNDACENIEDLEQLVREWRHLTISRNVLPASEFHKLQKQTKELLGEDEP